MGPVLPLSHTAKLVYAQYLLSVLGTGSETSVISSQPTCYEMEAVLHHLLKYFPHMVTSYMVQELAPPHLQALCLDSVFKQCGSSSREMRTEHVMNILQNVNLDSCAHSVQDNHVVILLAGASNLRHLSLANTFVSDKAFLLDEHAQLNCGTFSQQANHKEWVSPCSLVSIDVSGCSNFSSTGVRHLCSLTGPTLQNVNISCTQADFTALLYLSGLSLPDAVQFSLGVEMDPGEAPHLHLDQLRQELDRCQLISQSLRAQHLPPGSAGVKEEEVPDCSQCTFCGGLFSEQSVGFQELGKEGDELGFSSCQDSRCCTCTASAATSSFLSGHDKEQALQTSGGVSEHTEELRESRQIEVSSSSECAGVSDEDVQLDVKTDLHHSQETCSAKPSVDTCVGKMNVTDSECTSDCHSMTGNRFNTDVKNLAGVHTSSGTSDINLDTGPDCCTLVSVSEEQETKMVPQSPITEASMVLCSQRQESDSTVSKHGTMASLPQGFELSVSKSMPGLSDCGTCEHSGCSDQVTSSIFDKNTHAANPSISDVTEGASRMKLHSTHDMCPSTVEEKAVVHETVSESAHKCLCDDASTSSKNNLLVSPPHVTVTKSSISVDAVSTAVNMKDNVTAPLLCTDHVSVTDSTSHTDIGNTDFPVSEDKKSARGTQLLFTPNITGMCLSSDCLGGQHSMQLGLASLNKFLTANPQLRSLDIVCSPGMPLLDQVLEVIGQKVPGLKHLSLDSAETITDSGISQLLNSCTSLSKIDLSGAAFISDAGLLPLRKNGEVEELMLSESSVAAPTLLTVAVGFASQVLRILELAWCENVDETSINRALRTCSGLTRLNLRQCPVTDRTLGVIGTHCTKITDLGLSCVKDITDAAVTSLVGCLGQLKSVDLSWNLDLTDVCVGALLATCPWLHTAELSGLKRITSVPFLPIIADIEHWRRQKTVAGNRCKSQDGERDSQNSLAKSLSGCQPRRSTSYATCLQHLYLHYCDQVTDWHMEEVAFACHGALTIINYYGEAATPKIHWT
ncbi:hypothetical protein BaRGS_00010909 [Batillaria attramentaria]|uniref:F-box/LRR-repeat protein 15-like leucin rich repeat domain-containing protein n=1 Tax=Batillaria attramentaria TaxID=370345 RepID=A0ABD0LEH9_9CAEN